MADKRALSGLFGGDDEYDNNVIRGLLGMAAGAFSPQANTAGQALGLGIQSGLGAVDQGRQMTAQAAMRKLQEAQIKQQMARPMEMDPRKDRYVFNQKNGAWELSSSGTPQKTALEAKIQEIMASQNVDRQTASAIATGVIGVGTDPVTGQQFLYDKARKTTTNLSGEFPAVSPEQAQSPGKEQANKKQTGISPFSGVNIIKRAASESIGGIWPGLVFKDEVEAGQAARLLREQIKGSFRSSGRPTNFQEQRAEALLPSMTNPFGSSEVARIKLQATVEAIRKEMDENRIIANNNSQSVEARKEAIRAYNQGKLAVQSLEEMIKRPSSKKDQGEWTIKRKN